MHSFDIPPDVEGVWRGEMTAITIALRIVSVNENL